MVCELSRPLRKKNKTRTTPSFALAMLIVNFVGVVRGFRGPTTFTLRSFFSMEGSLEVVSQPWFEIAG